MNNREQSFTDAVESAIAAAVMQSEFALSRAECESALQPLVDRLKAMPLDEARAYIKASYRFGSCDQIAVRMFNDQRFARELLARSAAKASPRRFTGEPITGFGSFEDDKGQS